MENEPDEEMRLWTNNNNISVVYYIIKLLFMETIITWEMLL